MTVLDDFHDWLENQDYWIRQDKVEEKFPELEWRESTGVTAKEDDEGNILVPRRDLRALAKNPDTDSNPEIGDTK